MFVSIRGTPLIESWWNVPSWNFTERFINQL